MAFSNLRVDRVVHAGGRGYKIPALSEDLITLGVNIILAHVDNGTLRQVYDEIKKHPVGFDWIIENEAHHGWGTAVRNLLRQHGLKDNMVGSGNLDDYYVEIVEGAVEKLFDDPRL